MEYDEDPKMNHLREYTLEQWIDLIYDKEGKLGAFGSKFFNRPKGIAKIRTNVEKDRLRKGRVPVVMGENAVEKAHSIAFNCYKSMMVEEYGGSDKWKELAYEYFPWQIEKLESFKPVVIEAYEFANLAQYVEGFLIKKCSINELMAAKIIVIENLYSKKSMSDKSVTQADALFVNKARNGHIIIAACDDEEAIASWGNKVGKLSC